MGEGSKHFVVISCINFQSFSLSPHNSTLSPMLTVSFRCHLMQTPMFHSHNVFTPMRMEFCPFNKNFTFWYIFFFQILIYLGEGLKNVCQHLQRRLPAGVMLIEQLRHHEVQVVLQLPPQGVVQQVLQVDLAEAAV